MLENAEEPKRTLRSERRRKYIGREYRRPNIEFIDFQTLSFNICRLASSVFVGVLRAIGRNETNKFIKRFQSCTNRALTLTCQSWRVHSKAAADMPMVDIESVVNLLEIFSMCVCL